MAQPLFTYRTVAVEDAGPCRYDRRHPLVVGGYHDLLLRREGGGVVDRIAYLPTARKAALDQARRWIDGYAAQGFSWVGPPEGARL